MPKWNINQEKKPDYADEIKDFGNKKNKENSVELRRNQSSSLNDKKFTKEWTKKWPYILPVADDETFFYCLFCNKVISCKYQGKADVERHINTYAHTIIVKRFYAKTPTKGSNPKRSKPCETGGSLSKRRKTDQLSKGNENPDILPITQQKQNYEIPMIQNVPGSIYHQQSSRSSGDSAASAVVILEPEQSNNVMKSTINEERRTEMSSTLAAQGATVFPGIKTNVLDESNYIYQQQQQHGKSCQSIHCALNLNSNASMQPICGASHIQYGKSNVQHNNVRSNNIEKTCRPPMVSIPQNTFIDLSSLKDQSNGLMQLWPCLICKEQFQSELILIQHLQNHNRYTNSAYGGERCVTQYPTGKDLATNTIFHKKMDAIVQSTCIQLALPVVDLESPNTLEKLKNLGIQNYIPLTQLSAETEGYFGLPLMPINDTGNQISFGATSIIGLAPIKNLFPS